MAGMTTIGANKADSLATIHAAFDAGVNFLDTAFAYGRDGESDQVIAEFLRTAIVPNWFSPRKPAFTGMRMARESTMHGLRCCANIWSSR